MYHIHHYATCDRIIIIFNYTSFVIPEKKVLIKKLLGANISQRKDRVDSQEQSTIERNHLQTLQARL